MAAKKVEITDSLFMKYKKKYLHHWTYLGEWEQVSRTVKKALCRCDLCGTKHKVMWRALTEGRSTRCKACARKMTGIEVEDFNSSLKKAGSLYRITGECKSNGSGRRHYWVVCAGCDNGHWVTLESVQKSKSCQPCSQSWWQRDEMPKPKPKPKVVDTGSLDLPMGARIG